MKNINLFKLTLLIIFLLVIDISAISQNNLRDTVFFNKEWKRTTIRDSVYIYGFKDYNEDSVGLATYYFKNGQLHSYQNEKKNLKHGECTWFYTNGNMKVRANYLNDKLEGKLERWYEDGGLMNLEYYENGKAVGTFESFNRQGEAIEFVVYENGSVKLAYSIINKEKVYGKPQQIPLFNGAKTILESDKNIIAFISKNTFYPELARYKNHQDRVLVSFIIDKKGRVKIYKVTGIYSELNDVAKEVVLKTSKKWTPGLVESKKVNCLMTLPVVFVLK